MKRDYDGLLKSGNKAQLEKLKENENKCGFDKVDIFYATQRIADEQFELAVEVNNQMKNEKERLKSIRSEAADVANFAHMIIYRCDKELENLE